MYKQLILLTAALFFTGCQAQAPADSGDTGKPSVYTSFYVMADFAEKIGGDKIVVTNMTPLGGAPHDWEPTPADMAGLSNADVFIYNGAGLEHWLDTTLSAIDTNDLTLVCTTNNIEIMSGTAHNHDENDETHTDETHTDETHTDETHTDEAGYDPHVWLSVSKAKKQLENIKDALVATDPDNAQYYEDNYNKYAQQFDMLDAEYADSLGALPNKDIVVSHAAFGYLCQDYGLKQTAIEGLLPHSEPDPATLAHIIDFVKENDISTVFYEENGSSKTAEIVANETGAKLDTLNIVEGISQEQIEKGEDYLSVMRRNLQSLKAALA